MGHSQSRSLSLVTFSLILTFCSTIVSTGEVQKVFDIERDLETNEPVSKYDYIILGGGGAGCTIGRTLADSGFSVLLVERGLDGNHTLVQDIYGAGLVINERAVSQPVTTAQGVATHAASVLGGGTAVGFGIWIEETDEFFNLLQEDYKASEMINVDPEYTSKSPPNVEALEYPRILDAFSWLKTELGLKTTSETNGTTVKRPRAVPNIATHVPPSNEPFANSRTRRVRSLGPSHNRNSDNSNSETFNNDNNNEMNSSTAPHFTLHGRQGYSDLLRGLVPEADVGLSSKLHTDRQWEPLSMFVEDKDGIKKRHHSGYLTEVVKGSGDLTILLGSTAEKVIFDENRKASCVELRSTRYSDFRKMGEVPIKGVSRVPSIFESGILKTFIDFSSTVSHHDDDDDESKFDKFGSDDRLNREYKEMTICLKGSSKNDSSISNDQDSIIIAAGALETPLLLMRSGIGSEQDLTRLNVEDHVVHNDHVGQNLMDRLMTPISFYLPARSPDMKMLTDPVVCETVALSSSQCPATSESNVEGCLLAGFEEMSGARLVEGFLSANKLFVPLPLRNSQVADNVSSLTKLCRDYQWNSTTGIRDQGLQHSKKHSDDGSSRELSKSPFSSNGNNNNNDWTTKSRTTKVKSDMPQICRLFLSVGECMDRQLGWVNMLSDVRSRGSVSISENGNPIFDAKYLSSRHDMNSMVFGIRKLIERANELSKSLMFDNHGFGHQSSSDCPGRGMEPIFNRLEQLVMAQASQVDSSFSLTPLVPNGNKVGLLKETPIPQYCEYVSDQPPSKWYSDYRPICRGVEDLEDETLIAPDAEISPNLVGFNNPDVESSIPLTTFPPYMPNPNNTTELEQFVRAYSSSMWHWAGSASLGSVVDSNFNVYGVDRLKIIDSSIFPRLTRMNPTATFLAVARSAAMVIADKRV